MTSHSDTSSELMQRRIQENFARQGMMTLLQAQLVQIQLGCVHIEMPFQHAQSQQHGFIHAGAITSIVDSACGYAALTTMPTTHEVLSIEFKMNFLRPALGEKFIAIGKVVKSGKSIYVCSGEVSAHAKGQQKIIAMMQATMMAVAIPHAT